MGCVIICIVLLAVFAFQTVAYDNTLVIGGPHYPNPNEIAFNYSSPNVTYYRLHPSFVVYSEMKSSSTVSNAGCIDEVVCNNDSDYIFVSEEGIMQWSWYSLSSASLPLSPTEPIDEIIVTIEGMFTNQATTKVCTALAPNGIKYDEIPLELISRNQSVIYPFYQRIQYKWENNPTKINVYKSWDWEDVKKDFQVGIGAYYNNYDNENGELRISQLYVDIGV